MIPLHAANPGPMTGSGNWTFLLPGVRPALIDAGVGAAAHLDAIAEAIAGGPQRVLVTHGHSDHASGATALAARWPHLQFFKWSWPASDKRYPVSWQALSDDELVPAGDDMLRVIHTPGHAPDHVCFWHEPSRALYCGDLVVAGSTVVIPASSGGSLSQYLQSLERVRSLRPARLLPAHGPPIDDVEGIIAKYLAHRQERERQVLAALADGCRSVPAMVDRIYVDLAAPLVLMARESILAHLQKLEDEGRVAHRGGEWQLLG